MKYGKIAHHGTKAANMAGKPSTAFTAKLGVAVKRGKIAKI